MRKLLGGFYLGYSAIVFFVLMVIVCPFIVISTSIFREKTGRKIAFYFLKFWAWGFSLFTCLWFSANNAKIDTSKSYIYVGNHSSFLDAVAIVICIPQAFSPLGKIEMLKIPVFGWIYKRLVVMIDRSSRESRGLERWIADYSENMTPEMRVISQRALLTLKMIDQNPPQTIQVMKTNAPMTWAAMLADLTAFANAKGHAAFMSTGA